MPYYTVGDYYGRGDYYRGDSIFKKIGKAIGGAVKAVVRASPVGQVVQAVAPRLLGSGGGGGGVQVRAPQFINIAPPTVDMGMPGATPPALIPQFSLKKGMRVGGRRMNPMNSKALRRASRRIDGFVRTARKALKHTQYTIARRGAGGRRGSPGRITRAEAARALKA